MAAQWTIQLDTADGVCTAATESGVRRRAQEKADGGIASTKIFPKQSSEARRSWDWTVTLDWG